MQNYSKYLYSSEQKDKCELALCDQVVSTFHFTFQPLLSFNNFFQESYVYLIPPFRQHKNRIARKEVPIENNSFFPFANFFIT